MQTLGMILRRRREEKKFSLREVARQAGISPSYLSDIELDRRQPAEPVLREIARVIAEDAEELACHAGRLSPKAVDYLRLHPRLVLLVNRIASREVSEEVLLELERNIDAWLKEK